MFGFFVCVRALVFLVCFVFLFSLSQGVGFGWLVSWLFFVVAVFPFPSLPPTPFPGFVVVVVRLLVRCGVWVCLFVCF